MKAISPWRSPGSSREAQSQRAPLEGKLLPDPGTVGLSPDAVSRGKPLLLCLFDAEQRPSRRAVRLLAEQYATLAAKGLTIVAVQAAVTTDETFKEWQANADAPFPIGRVTAKSPQNRWATDVQSLPWLILTDVTGKVAIEGFPIDELNTKLEPLGM